MTVTPGPESKPASRAREAVPEVAGLIWLPLLPDECKRDLSLPSKSAFTFIKAQKKKNVTIQEEEEQENIEEYNKMSCFIELVRNRIYKHKKKEGTEQVRLCLVFSETFIISLITNECCHDTGISNFDTIS